MKRRRNPKKPNLLLLGGLAAAGYLGYKALQPTPAAAPEIDSTTNTTPPTNGAGGSVSTFFRRLLGPPDKA